MKIPIRLFAIIVLGFCFNVAADETKTPSATNPDSSADASSSAGFSESQILQEWGYILAYQAGADHIEASDADLTSFVKGVAEGYKAAPCPYYYEKIMPDVKKMAKARREKITQAILDKNQTAATAFFTELDKNPNVVKLPSGLRYQIIQPGVGPCPQPQQTVNVHVVSHLLNGTEFRQIGPVDIVLWPDRFDKYLFEGLQKINKGGRIRLYISDLPTEWEIEMYGIQPGSTMIDEVELLDIKQTPPDVLADTLAPPAPEPPPDPPSGYSDQQIIETWGWSVTRRTSVHIMNLSDDELSSLTQGLVAAVKGQPPPYDLHKIEPEVRQFVTDRRAKGVEAFKEKQLADADAFFAELKKNKDVVVLPSGLCYQIIQPGTGPYPKPGQKVKIQFSGQLLNGKVFEHTFPEDPRKIVLGVPPKIWVVAGLNEGLQKINLGGKIKLYIPPSLGYGAEGENGAPPYSTLIYDIELVSIADLPPDEHVPLASQPSSGSGT